MQIRAGIQGLQPKSTSQPPLLKVGWDVHTSFVCLADMNKTKTFRRGCLSFNFIDLMQMVHGLP